MRYFESDIRGNPVRWTEHSRYGRRISKPLGYLPQNFGYYPEFTAEKFMLYMAALKGLNRSFAKNRTEELLRLVGLEKEHREKD